MRKRYAAAHDNQYKQHSVYLLQPLFRMSDTFIVTNKCHPIVIHQSQCT